MCTPVPGKGSSTATNRYPALSELLREQLQVSWAAEQSTRAFIPPSRAHTATGRRFIRSVAIFFHRFENGDRRCACKGPEMPQRTHSKLSLSQSMCIY